MSSKPTSTSLLKKEDRQMFMELGIVATSNFLAWEGHALFGQLLLADPHEAYPRLGLAYCKMMGGQFEDAHKLLKNSVVEKSPLKDYALALRGLAYHLEKKPDEMMKLFKDHEKSLEENMAALGMFKTLLESLES